jgi:hypothetical protein
MKGDEPVDIGSAAARGAPDVGVAPGDERMSPALKICEMRELLAEQYRMAPAPDPSRELLAWMDLGTVVAAAEDTGPDEVLVPLAPRPARRLSYLVAATVASALAMSGLATAGALPASLQRGAASVASVIAIDLPAPAANPSPDVRDPRAPRARDDDKATRRVAVPAPPPVDTGARAPAPALPPEAEPSGSGVGSIPGEIVPPLGDLPVVELPDLPVPELPPPVPSSVNGAPPISAR